MRKLFFFLMILLAAQGVRGQMNLLGYSQLRVMKVMKNDYPSYHLKRHDNFVVEYQNKDGFLVFFFFKGKARNMMLFSSLDLIQDQLRILNHQPDVLPSETEPFTYIRSFPKQKRSFLIRFDITSPDKTSCLNVEEIPFVKMKEKKLEKKEPMYENRGEQKGMG